MVLTVDESRHVWSYTNDVSDESSEIDSLSTQSPFRQLLQFGPGDESVVD